MKFWNIEWTTGNAITAANAVILLKVDDAVFIFDDGSICRTCTEATGIFAVHALILPHKPHQIAIALILNELDQIVIIPLGGGHRLVRIVEGGFSKRMIIPFDAGDFASFATDAGRDVDIFTDLFFASRTGARHRTGMRRDLLNLKCAWVTHFMPSQPSPEIL
jgi:hypothetical protein